MMAREGFLAPSEPKSATLPAPMKIMKLEKLTCDFLPVEHDQERTDQDADHQEEDRAQAVGHGGPAAGVCDGRVQAQHRREMAQEQEVDQEKHQILAAEHPENAIAIAVITGRAIISLLLYRIP